MVAALEEQRDLLEAGLARTSRRGQLSRARLDARRRQIREEIVRLGSLVALRAEQVNLSREALEAVQAMDGAAQGVISLDEIRGRRARLLSETLHLDELKLSLVIKQAELENVELELASLPVEQDDAKASLQRSLAELEAQRTTQGADQAFAVLAPASGRVSALQASAGQFISRAAPLCAIVPLDAVLEARVFVPTRAAGWVTPGQTVQLMYDAFPHEHYGVHAATVDSVAEAILNPHEFDSPVPLEEPAYAATLRLASQQLAAFGRQHSLQAGMLLTGHVQLEERSLLRWLLRPLYALENR